MGLLGIDANDVEALRIIHDEPQYTVGWGLTPHKCPVCVGKGTVPTGFYLTHAEAFTANTTEPDECRSCKGAGVIWR